MCMKGEGFRLLSRNHISQKETNSIETLFFINIKADLIQK